MVCPRTNAGLLPNWYWMICLWFLRLRNKDNFDVHIYWMLCFLFQTGWKIKTRLDWFIMELNTTDAPVILPLCRPLLRGNRSTRGNMSVSSASEHSVSGKDLLEFTIPVICALGVIGNLLNLLVLTRRRLLCTMDRLEKSATYGLIALAFSDMMFCVAAFPYVFIAKHGILTDKAHAYVLYYKIYGIGCINMFLMTSTWLVVSMALNRYLVVVYPFRARQSLSASCTIVSITLIYFLSLLFTIPFYLHIKVRKCQWYDDDYRYELKSRWAKYITDPMRIYIQWAWPVVAVFIPVLVLAFCNTRLIQTLRHAQLNRRSTCRGQTISDKSLKVTRTLVIIVLMLLFLVSPSEILRYINPYRHWGYAGEVVALITNIMQATNFAVNFILYCAVNATFRQTLKSFCRSCTKSKSEFPEKETMLSPMTVDASLDVTNDGLSATTPQTEECHE